MRWLDVCFFNDTATTEIYTLSLTRRSSDLGCAFLIGNEGNGLRDEVSECADCLIRIPMCGKAESLNAAVAAAVLMFEAGRQRRK